MVFAFCIPYLNVSASISTDTETSSIQTEATPTGHSIDGFKKSEVTQSLINIQNSWKATDYIQGDIVKKTYTVQLGDTLWEIAEAYYGNGSAWTQILEKNKNDIGFLNGEQSLIMEGQVLSI